MKQYFAETPMTTLRELGLLFLRLGTTAFGGPAAHIAMMQDEVVRRRSWLTQQDFLDLLGATNLIPGPNSTEMAIHIGHRRGGWPGLLIAGTCFIVPAALIVGVAAHLYVSYGSIPKVKGLLYGVKPAIIAIICQALYSLARTAVTNRGMAVIAIASVGAVLVGVHELVVLGSAGLLAMLRTSPVTLRQIFCDVSGLSLSPILMLSTATYVRPFAIWPLFAFFVKVGSVLFGSGYVLLAFLRADLVERWHWLTEAQLLDAIAVGTGHAWTGVHDGDIHWLSARWGAGRNCRDTRNLRTRVCFRRDKRTACAANTAKRMGRGIPGWGERRITRANGRRHPATRSIGADRLANDCHRCLERVGGHSLPCKFCVSGDRGRTRRILS